MHDQQRSAKRRPPNHNPSVLIFRVVRIGKSDGERIVKHGGGFFKGNAVLSPVFGGLVEVPLKSWPHRSCSLCHEAIGGGVILDGGFAVDFAHHAGEGAAGADFEPVGDAFGAKGFD